MRPRSIALGVVSSVAVLVMGWQVGGQAALDTSTGTSASAPLVDGTGTGSSGSSTSTGSSGTSTADTSTGTSSGTASSGSTSSGSASTATAGVSGTFTGAAATTRYGTVQVEITVADGTITDVTALKLTDEESRSAQISARAEPTLQAEALAAQSASIQSVSGATYTSQGYITSLQSAIDQAGL